MTRRLAITILLTVWAMLIAGGVVAYAVTRTVLLDAFDESLFAYASSVPGVIHAAGSTPSLNAVGGDRYLVKDNLDRTVGRPGNTSGMEPKLLSATFSYAQGERIRTVEVRAFAENRKPVTVIYTRSAAAFDARMNRLAVTFAIFGVVAGLLTAAVTWRVSKSALRPLSQTARQIESIDERRLDLRIDPTALPPELQPMAEKLNELLARLEAAFAARQRFLADASHELRTPLAALIMAMEVSLRHPREAAAYRATLQNCLADANAMRLLVERLMEQVRSQNLSNDEAPAEVELSSLLSQIAQAIDPLASARGLQLTRNLPTGVRCVTLPGRLRGAVMNLLSNAIEYNQPGGKVELACTVDANRSRVAIRVTDSGIGIAPEHLGHVFEPFYRADPSRSRPEGHLGLGLSLVHAHAAALGGTCTVESILGKGTTFTIEFAAKLFPEMAAGTKVTEIPRSHSPLIEAS